MIARILIPLLIGVALMPGDTVLGPAPWFVRAAVLLPFYWLGLVGPGAISAIQY